MRMEGGIKKLQECSDNYLVLLLFSHCQEFFFYHFIMASSMSAPLRKQLFFCAHILCPFCFCLKHDTQHCSFCHTFSEVTHRRPTTIIKNYNSAKNVAMIEAMQGKYLETGSPSKASLLCLSKRHKQLKDRKEFDDSSRPPSSFSRSYSHLLGPLHKVSQYCFCLLSAPSAHKLIDFQILWTSSMFGQFSSQFITGLVQLCHLQHWYLCP